jgi:hypothetical protein
MAIDLLKFRPRRADSGRTSANLLSRQSLLNGLPAADFGVTYWRDGDREVDFVVTRGAQVWAIEIKSGRPGGLSGIEAFKQRYPKARGALARIQHDKKQLEVDSISPPPLGPR